MGHPQEGHAVEHLPAIEQNHQYQPNKKFVAKQPFTLISEYFTQGSDPPQSARRHSKIPDRSDRDTWGLIPD